MHGVVLPQYLGWRQDNGNRTNQESKFDFLATRQQLVKIEGGQKSSAPTNNQIYGVPANQFSPSAGTTLLNIPFLEWGFSQIYFCHSSLG